MNESELNQKFMVFEQEIKHYQDQLNAVEKAILDSASIYDGLNDLKGKEGQEVLAPMGRGIFAKAKLISENLKVEVGEGVFIDKSIDDTKELISTQQEKLKNMQKEIEGELTRINNEITQTMREFQEQQKQ